MGTPVIEKVKIGHVTKPGMRMRQLFCPSKICILLTFSLVTGFQSCHKDEEPYYSFSKNSIIADYPFDGTAQDVSGHSLHGAIYGATPVSGRTSESDALLFDGVGDFVELPGSLALSTDTSFSIETWIYKDSVTSDGKYNDDGIFGQSDGSMGSDFPLIVLEIYEDRTLRGAIRGSGDPLAEVHPDETVEDSVWHHIVMVRDAERETLSLYLDGNLLQSADTELTGNNASNDFISIGAIYDDLESLHHFYCGKIDMIRFWNIPLNSSEVDALYRDEFVIE